jgi:hypothetical protein
MGTPCIEVGDGTRPAPAGGGARRRWRRSRSRRRYRVGSRSQPQVYTTCSAVQSAVGCRVTRTCRICRVSWRLKNTVRILKKSHAQMSLAWRVRHVRQVGEGTPSWGRRMYLATVRADTGNPNRASSAWTLRCPHGRFSTAMRRIKAEGCTNPGSCRGLVIFVEHTAQEVPPTHVRLHRRGHRLVGSLRRGQLEPPMWPLGIVVVDVNSEHALEMPLVQDEEPV